MEQVKKEKAQPNKRVIAVIAAVLLVAAIVIERVKGDIHG